MLGLEVRRARSSGLMNTNQFTIEATSVAIEFVVKASAPQGCVSGTTVRALGFYTSRSGMGCRLVTGEACAGDVGRPGILRLDTQGRPLARLGIDSGEGREFVHGRSERCKGSHVREGRGSERSVSCFRLVERRSGLHFDIFGLEVFMETGGRRPGARGLDCSEEFIEGQFDRWADDVEMIDTV